MKGRHCSPLKMVIGSPLQAFAVSRFTTKSKRGRGERPNTVANRRMVGWKSLLRAAIKTFSESTFVCAYTEMGVSGEDSCIRLSDAPYTLQLEAKINRLMPAPLATSISIAVAA